MVKPYFTRKNLMVIALAFFYGLLLVFTGVCISGGDDTLLSNKNIINLIGKEFGFKSIECVTKVKGCLMLIVSE